MRATIRPWHGHKESGALIIYFLSPTLRWPQLTAHSFWWVVILFIKILRQTSLHPKFLWTLQLFVVTQTLFSPFVMPLWEAEYTVEFGSLGSLVEIQSFSFCNVLAKRLCIILSVLFFHLVAKPENYSSLAEFKINKCIIVYFSYIGMIFIPFYVIYLTLLQDVIVT